MNNASIAGGYQKDKIEIKNTMTNIIERICKTHNISLTGTKRFTVGQGNYVFQISTERESFVIRLGHDSY